MRKFLMAAALLAVVACGDKKGGSGDTVNMTAPAPAPTMSDSMHKADSMKADSVRKDSIAKDSMAKAGKPPATK